MASYWKSLPRYYCKYCNYWCVDNKINVQKHESSELHRANIDRYLTKQKVTREREEAHSKEVQKIIKQAENDARDSMYKTHTNTGVESKKKSAYLFDRGPPIAIPYDTVPTMEQWQASLYQNAPVVYDESIGNVPPPPPVGSTPVVYDESIGNVPPPPPVGSTPVVYNESVGNIPPPPPVGSTPITYNESIGNVPPPPVGSTPITDNNSIRNTTPSNSTSDSQPPIKYNFDYESKLTEEDLFGSWKTVSVTELTEKDLARREEQYEKAVMKSSKDPTKKKTQPKIQKKDHESEDEDEKDAFDLYNPFGGKYKGVDLSASEPVYNPNKTPVIPKEEFKKEKEPTKEEEPKQFISTSIAFSFAPKKTNAEKKEIKPRTNTLSSFFSLHVCKTISF